MKILFDECVSNLLREHLPGCEIFTVREMGWGSKSNGELLRLAAGSFDVFLTVDQNLRFQQNILDSPIAVVVLVVSRNRLKDYLPLVDKLKETSVSVKPRHHCIVNV